jgi:hypothetical protein
MSRICSLLLLLSVVTLGGCRSAGSLVYELRSLSADGQPQLRRVEISTPSHPDQPGTIQIAPDGTVSASTGSEPKVLASSKSLAKLSYVGAALLLGGILLTLLKVKLPMLPIELGLGCAVTGLSLIVLPSLVEAYLPYIFIGLVATAVLFTIYRFNRVGLRLRQIDPSDPTPDPRPRI